MASLKPEKEINNYNRAVSFDFNIHMTSPNIFAKLFWNNSEQFAAL